MRAKRNKSERALAIREKSETVKEMRVAIDGETVVGWVGPLMGDRNVRDALNLVLGTCVAVCTNTFTDTLKRVDGTSQLPLKGQIRDSVSQSEFIGSHLHDSEAIVGFSRVGRVSWKTKGP